MLIPPSTKGFVSLGENNTATSCRKNSSIASYTAPFRMKETTNLSWREMFDKRIRKDIEGIAWIMKGKTNKDVFSEIGY